jgi:hypothetical protein
MLNVTAVQALLDAGGDIYRQNRNGEDVLAYAKWMGTQPDLRDRTAWVTIYSKLVAKAMPELNWAARRSLILLREKLPWFK